METSPVPQTTLRHLKELEELGTLAKRGHEDTPGVVEYALSEAGGDLLAVVAALERWLAEAPDGALSFSDEAGKATIKALVGGWSSTVMHSLATSPCSLSKLAGGIRAVSYPSVERRLSALRITAQVEASAGDGKGTPYVVTDWLRKSVGPLATAVRWEDEHLPDGSAAMEGADAETVFLLAMPLLRASSSLNGSCLMAMEVKGAENRLAGVVVGVEDGRVSSCTASLEQPTDARATGSQPAWTEAMVGGGAEGLEIGGRRRLASALLEGLEGRFSQWRVLDVTRAIHKEDRFPVIIQTA